MEYIKNVWEDNVRLLYPMKRKETWFLYHQPDAVSFPPPISLSSYHPPIIWPYFSSQCSSFFLLECFHWAAIHPDSVCCVAHSAIRFPLGQIVVRKDRTWLCVSSHPPQLCDGRVCVCIWLWNCVWRPPQMPLFLRPGCSTTLAKAGWSLESKIEQKKHQRRRNMATLRWIRWHYCCLCCQFGPPPHI